MRVGARLLIPALLTLLAGVLLGIALGKRSQPVESLLEEDLAGWAASYSETLELSAEQQSDLLILLTAYQRERRSLLRSQYSELADSLAWLDERFEGLIEGRVLDNSQRKSAAQLRTGRLPAAAMGG